MTPIYMQTYVNAPGLRPSEVVRMALFSWGTIAGLIVAAVLLLLLMLSNDVALRTIGMRWWKRLHRTSYLAFLLTALHGLAFQVLESRAAGWIALVLAASIAVLAMQIKGVGRVRGSRAGQALSRR
jgi:DMSO/TMAO reductase YedYZ heme-binding membrane subunit